MKGCIEYMHRIHVNAFSNKANKFLSALKVAMANAVSFAILNITVLFNYSKFRSVYIEFLQMSLFSKPMP